MKNLEVDMAKELWGRIKEGIFSIGPIYLVLLLIDISGLFLFDSKPIEGSVQFENIFTPNYYANNYASSVFGPFTLCLLISFIPLVLGSSLFGMGADQAMSRIGTAIGENITKKRSLILLGVVALLMGTLVTLAEPDLSVFSAQLMGENHKWVMVAVVSIGVGLLLAFALIRILKQWSYKFCIVGLEFIVFALALLIDKDKFMPIIFDGAGTTTGSISAPFIVAFGIAVAQVKGSKDAENDSFGVSGLASLGPLITVPIMCMFSENINFSIDIPTPYTLLTEQGYNGLGALYGSNLLDAMQDTLFSLAPVLAFFIIYDLCFLHMKKKELIQIFIGFLYTFVGLSLFLMGVNSSFYPLAWKMGLAFGSNGYDGANFAVVLVIMGLLGLVIILAEPSVHVLAKQVEDVSRGSIRSKDLFFAMCAALMVVCILAVTRVKYINEIDYTVIIVALLLVSFAISFFVPDLFFALSFDSAGVASGTMSSAFLLPLCTGMSSALYPYDKELQMKSGFGVIGLVAMISLVSIQLLGLYGNIKTYIKVRRSYKAIFTPDDSQVIHLPSSADSI